jgi:hypothetical protein
MFANVIFNDRKKDIINQTIPLQFRIGEKTWPMLIAPWFHYTDTSYAYNFCGLDYKYKWYWQLLVTLNKLLLAVH